MADRWRFSGERLLETPSRRCGLNPDGELAARQHTAEQINELGVQLGVSQLTISTAIVYMRRFYMFHSFTKFEGNVRTLSWAFGITLCLNICLCPLIILVLSQDIIMLESILLQTLGFDITIDHPHTHVLRCMQFVTASRDLTQTSYFMATNR
uniref:Uncharacterized protein n=1 Tax=Eptatretus burgeri TaxID=7764 RepID=A0A8C4NBG4_EPTBU